MIRKSEYIHKSSCLLLAAMIFLGNASPALAKTQRDCVKVDQVGSYGMLPVYNRDVEEGTYHVSTQTTSTYFRLHDPYLTVDAEGMSLNFYIDSESYSYIYPGTPEEAAEADEQDWIAADTQDGVSYFTIPVEALDSPIECAAYSVKKKKWYERQIMVLASSLPEESVKISLPDYDKIAKAIDLYNESNESEELTEAVTEMQTEASEPEAIEVNMADGNYSIEVAMIGGSGRAMVTSPTKLTIKDKKAYVTLLWSSANYDYMILNGYRYDNETTDGGKSSFTLPITAMDEPVDVIADTTAMDEPVEISYQLTFYEDTIGDEGMIPQEAAKRVLLASLIFIVAGGILNWFVKKRLSKRK